MFRSRWLGRIHTSLTRSLSRRRSYRPQLEALENRWVPSAIQAAPGFAANTLGNRDDGFVGPVSIGFTAQFSTVTFNQVFVNNNGNVTVGSGNSLFSPTNFNTTTRTIFGPFVEDVDTRNNNAVTYGTGVLDGRNAFAVTWPDVGYFQMGNNRLDAFQVVFIDRSDTGAGNFDLHFNYDQIEWDSSDSSDGTDGLGGSSSAVAGFSAGTHQPLTDYTFAGSGIPGSFLDSNLTGGLIHNSFQSNVLGRFAFFFRGGVLASNQGPMAHAGGPYSVAEGANLTLNGLTSSDPDADSLTFSWDVNGDGVFGDATGGNPTLSWAQLQSLGIIDGPSSFNVQVQVDDGQGHVTTSPATTLMIVNAPPTLTLAGAATSDEGSSYTLTLSSSDPGPDTIQSWTINWGDGAFDTLAGNPASATHVYADGDSDYTITATATDEDGTWTAGNSVAVHVNNLAPTLTLTGSGSSDEGATYTLNLAAGSDPGQDSISSWTITWGDGSVQIVSGNPPSVTHVYADGPNDYTITATATDEDGAWNAGNSVAVHVNNVAPTLTLSANASSDEGATYTLNLAGSDAGQDTISSWSIAWGDGTFETVSGNPASVTHVYADGDNDYTIFATATDDDGAWNAGNSVAVHVNNLPPTLTLSGNAVVLAGSTYTLNLASSDPGQDTIALWTITWGDGNVDIVSGNPGSVTHVYASGPNDYSISATGTDEDGTWNAGNSVSVHVDAAAGTNAAPILDELTSSALQVGAAVAGGQVTIAASFTDADAFDTHTAVIHWGDGTTSDGTITEAGGAGTIAGGHVYSQGGVYDITVTLTDNHDGSTTGTTFALVTGAGVQDGVLNIIGTTRDDHVQVNQRDDGQLKVAASFFAGPHVRSFDAAGIERIVVRLGGGNDVANVAHKVKIPTLLDGGAGHDVLKGGGGADILLGGDGRDVLHAGAGRDLLIGGRGSDLLVGGDHEDILIAGRTDFDALDAALWALLDEWNSSRSRADRIANLSGTGSGTPFEERLNGNYFLDPGTTVHNDGARDLLIARHGDWVFANSRDWVAGLGH